MSGNEDTRSQSNPFAWVSLRARPRLFAVLGVLFIALSVWLAIEDRHLRTPAAPYGIVDFELAGTLDRSAQILDSWSERATAAAMFIQGLDYLYLLVYSAWLALAAARLGAALGGFWMTAGTVVSWLVLVAAPLDAVENFALVRQLTNGPSALHAGLARYCAVPKFALVTLAVGYLLAGSGARLWRRRGSR